MAHVNVEIKALLNKNLDIIRHVLRDNNADFKGLDQQVDTYFNVSKGRLKLREGNIENMLVYYVREDKSGPKQSRVVLFKNEQGSSLKEILSKSLGVRVVVEKSREIYFIDNVKFHVDSVLDLGDFVEIEAISEHGNIGKEKLLEQCKHYIELFGIREEDLVSISYSDLMLKK